FERKSPTRLGFRLPNRVGRGVAQYSGMVSAQGDALSAGELRGVSATWGERIPRRVCRNPKTRHPPCRFAPPFLLADRRRHHSCLAATGTFTRSLVGQKCVQRPRAGTGNQ